MALSDGTTRVIAVGGYNQGLGTYINSIEYYNPTTNTWTTTQGKLPQVTGQNYGCVADNKLILMGGYMGNNVAVSQTIVFSPESLLNTTNPFSTFVSLPVADAAMACIPYH